MEKEAEKPKTASFSLLQGEKMSTKFIASGDCFITRAVPENGYSGFTELKSLIESADVRFTNLEMTFHDQEGYPAAASGGTWAMSDPRMLDEVCKYGFNLFNTANNHSGDFGQEGMMATIKHLKERNLVFAGSGKNLREAARACYLETGEARVALIGITSTFDPAAIAGGPSLDLIGRPGLNPLRFKTYHHVNDEHFRMLKELAEISEINNLRTLKTQAGYLAPLPDDTYPFGKLTFKRTEKKEHNETVPNQADLERTIQAIKEAKRQADIVLVSLHAHEFLGLDMARPAEFLRIFAKKCIDAGASVVIGHGPHELRGIEKYSGGLIFYSLGNFIFQTETVERQPAEAFTNMGLSADSQVGDLMDKRSDGGTRGFVAQKTIWSSILPMWEVKDGKITSVVLHPIDLQQQEPRSRRGSPRLTKSEEILLQLRALSKEFNTEIRIQDSKGYIDMNESK